MTRISILTCSNCTQDLDCASFGCLKAMNSRTGFFAEYPDDEPIELIGIINCAGCPTIGAHEKIMRKVKGLADQGAEYLHFAYCITALCPFMKVFEKVIRESYPQLKIVHGTHPKHDNKLFQEKISELLCSPRNNIPELIKSRSGS